jgi:hypothetical protein
LNFRIHGYPDDYWRITPSCLRRMLAPYAARLSGFQGHVAFPHTVMGMGIKEPAPSDCPARMQQVAQAYYSWLAVTEASLPLADKLGRRFARVYRSKGERRQIADYYKAELTLEFDTNRSCSPRRGLRAQTAAAR